MNIRNNLIVSKMFQIFNFNKLKLLFFCFSVIIFTFFFTNVLIDDVSAASFRGKSFADLKIDDVGNIWDSREPVKIMLVDKDANRDSQVTERLSIVNAYDSVTEENPAWDPNDKVWFKQGGIVSLKIGSPLMLVDSSNYHRSDLATNDVNALLSSVSASVRTEPYSGILFVSTQSDVSISNGNHLTITAPYTGTKLKSFISTESNVFSFFNYDIRSLSEKLSSGKINDFSIVLEDNTSSVTLVSSSDFQGFLRLTSEQINKVQSLANSEIKIKIIFNDVSNNAEYSSDTELPIVADFFSFGYKNDGTNKSDRINNAVYRLELQETGANTDTFEGYMEYLKVNQFTISEPSTYENLQTIGNSILFIAGIDEMDDEDSPRIYYNDLGADGSEGIVSSQQRIPFYSGTIQKFLEDGKAGIRINDMDLNANSKSIDIIRLEPPLIDGNAWNNNCNLPSDSFDLHNGYDLIETGINTGVFEGDVFTLHQEYCDEGIKKSTAGKSLVFEYADFRDSSGARMEWKTSFVLPGHSPIIQPIEDITVEADSSVGSRVIYDLIVNDYEDETTNKVTNVNCKPYDSNEIFPIGTTKITCTATDSSGNRVTEEFSVIVKFTSETYSSQESLTEKPIVCGTETYLVDGVCKPRPDQVEASDITLTSAEPRILDSNNNPISSVTAGKNYFVNVEVENIGKETKNFVAAYRHLASSTGNWSQWTWVSSSVNVGKYTGVSIPWTPTLVDSYEFDVQIWDSVQEKNILSGEKLIVSVRPSQTETYQEAEKTIQESLKSESMEPERLDIAPFVNKTKDPQSYVDRYLNEPEYKDWFDENYPEYQSIYDAVGLSEPKKEKVPDWIKNNAKWWSEDHIDDGTFVNGIQFLVKEKIINVSEVSEQNSKKTRPSFVDPDRDPQSYIDRYRNEPEYKDWFDSNFPDYTIYEAVGLPEPIPAWVKNTADWWSQGLITEDDFLKGVEYLVEKRIIRVS